jgi:hypothetical protein
MNAAMSSERGKRNLSGKGKKFPGWNGCLHNFFAFNPFFGMLLAIQLTVERTAGWRGNSASNRRDGLKRTAHMSKPLVTIENWAVVQSGAYVAFQELLPGNILTGKVFGHAKLADAKSIYTSPIVNIDQSMGVVETRNTAYRLGNMSEEYRSWDSEHRALTAA